MQPRMLKRSRPVAGVRQRGHERDGGRGVERPDGGEALPPFERVAWPPIALGLAREALQRTDCGIFQACSVARGPLLEFVEPGR